MPVVRDSISQLLLPDTATADVNSSVRMNHLCCMCLKIATQSQNLDAIAKAISLAEEERLLKVDGNLPPRDKGSIENADAKLLCEFFNHYDADLDLVNSALAGCHLCTLFCLCRETNGSYRMEKNVTNRNVTAHVNVRISLDSNEANLDLGQLGYFALLTLDVATKRAHLSLVFTSANECYVELSEQRLKFRSVLDICLPDLLPRLTGHSASAETTASARSISTASEATSKLTVEWLQDCVNNHPDCGINTLHAGFRPTRVLDVGSENKEETLIRLCNPRADNLELSYVTLSHCWGGLAPYTLNATTSPELYKGVSLSKFPSTFQDAIRICRSLQQQYLWIDSLCIQQDSSEDWEKESSMMGAVYSSSICTIAAVTAENSKAGCFTQRNPLINRPCWLSKNPALVVYIDKQEVHNRIPYQCLHSRGWVLQERLLSRRTLAFSNSGVFWECQQRTANEEHTSQIPAEALDQDTVNLKKTMRILQSNDQLLKGSLQHAFQFSRPWYDIARLYSKLDLTFASDRPVAFSGIAMAVEKWSGLTYYYGLWKEFIPQDLMWYTRYPYHDKARTGEVSKLDAGRYLYRPKRRSPSFSWLSSDVAIDYHAAHLHHAWDQSRTPRMRDFLGTHTIRMPRYMDSKFYIEEYDLERVERQRESDPFILVKKSYIGTEVRSSGLNSVELEYRTRLLLAHQPQKGEISPPWIYLRGPSLRFRTTKLGNRLGRSRWSHPYYSDQDVLGVEDLPPTMTPEMSATRQSQARDSSKSLRMLEVDPASGSYWFYPDDNFFEQLSEGCWVDVVCITIARWVRQPQGYFYAGGLVLTNSGGQAMDAQDKRVDLYKRMGYFEHFWRSKQTHWDDDGGIENVVLV